MLRAGVGLHQRAERAMPVIDPLQSARRGAVEHGSRLAAGSGQGLGDADARVGIGTVNHNERPVQAFECALKGHVPHGTPGKRQGAHEGVVVLVHRLPGPGRSRRRIMGRKSAQRRNRCPIPSAPLVGPHQRRGRCGSGGTRLQLGHLPLRPAPMHEKRERVHDCACTVRSDKATAGEARPCGGQRNGGQPHRAFRPKGREEHACQIVHADAVLHSRPDDRFGAIEHVPGERWVRAGPPSVGGGAHLATGRIWPPRAALALTVTTRDLTCPSPSVSTSTLVMPSRCPPVAAKLAVAAGRAIIPPQALTCSGRGRAAWPRPWTRHFPRGPGGGSGGHMAHAAEPRSMAGGMATSVTYPDPAFPILRGPSTLHGAPATLPALRLP